MRGIWLVLAIIIVFNLGISAAASQTFVADEAEKCPLCLVSLTQDHDEETKLGPAMTLGGKRRKNAQSSEMIFCHHKIHEECLNEHLKTSQKCPLCRIHIADNVLCYFDITPVTLEDRLFDAIDEENIPLIEELVGEGANLLAKRDRLLSPLHCAVWTGNVLVVRAFLRSVPSSQILSVINEPEGQGMSSLHYATKKRGTGLAIAKVLIEALCSVGDEAIVNALQVTDFEGLTPIEEAEGVIADYLQGELDAAMTVYDHALTRLLTHLIDDLELELQQR